MEVHQYIHGSTGEVMTEELFSDQIVRFLYSTLREKVNPLFKALTSSYMSSVLGYVNFDMPLVSKLVANKNFLSSCGVNLEECVEPLEHFDTPRKIFERQIRYWDCRPMDESNGVVVSPADAKALLGSLREGELFYLKDKFFTFDEIIGSRGDWKSKFVDGDYIVFRLTPDKYHYNHTPVAGKVLDVYEISGSYNSCNPTAVVESVTPYSKNKRVVTIIDTDVEGGTGVGIVAMLEIVALMIGEIRQCYSEEKYDNPQDVYPGLVMKKGQVKSLYRPGSSTDILFFEPGRVTFEKHLSENMQRTDVISRFSQGFDQTIVETDVALRSSIARAR